MIRLSLCAAAALSLVACGEPQTLKEVDPDVFTASVSAPNVNISARQGMVSESLAMMQLGMLLEDVFEGVQAGLDGSDDPALEHLVFHLSYESTDRLGNEGSVDFGTLRFPLSDVRAAKLENLMPLDLVDLADDVSPGAAFDVATRHCLSDEARRSPAFCAKVLAHSGF